jgi:type II secretory pathway pseudopilin PulG
MNKVGTLPGSTLGVEMERHEEQGFMLVGLIVAIFFVLLALSVAAPKMAQELRREREVEAVHRGNQYVRAIRLYYRKFGHYPGSVEQLEKTNNIRFLRQQYVDPMTGKADWRLIKVGEAKTTVKGFFGQPLVGLAPGLGSAAGNASAAAGQTGQTGSPGAFGGSSPSAFGGSSPGAGGLGSSSPGGGGLGSPSSGLGGSSGMPTLGGSSGTTGAAANGPPTLGGGSSGSGQTGSGQTGSGQTGSGPTGSGPGSTNSLGSLSGNASDSNGSSIGGGAPFVGVGVPKEGDSITVVNEQTTYNTWEFLYDPRIEQLYAKGALMGGGASGLGSAGGNSSGFGNTPGSGSGTTPGSGYGTTPGSGFGPTPGSGFGSSPGSSSPTAPTAPAQPPQQ